jgi:class 3 adenylate cyclase
VVEHPTGTVTFFMTDIEGSTNLWSLDARGMALAVERLEDLVEEVTASSAGLMVRERGEGDSHFVVFQRASDAVHAGWQLQRRLVEQPLAPNPPISLRIGIHTGEAQLRDSDYYGTVVNKAARLRAAAHGGQTVATRVTVDLAADNLPAELSFIGLGSHRLRGLPGREEVFQLCGPGLKRVFPPLVVPDTAITTLGTVVVFDVVGGSEIAARVSEEQLVDLQAGFFRLCRRAFDQSDGRHLRFLGDGGLAAFESPLAAMAFIGEVRPVLGHRGVRLRAGVHTGRMEHIGDELGGPATTGALALVDLAEGDEVVLSQTTVDMLPRHMFAVQSRGSTHIQSVSETWELFSLP